MMAARFSKQAIVDMLDARIALMEDKLGLDERNGYSQVSGKGDNWQRAYGEFRAYCDLRDSIANGEHDRVTSDATSCMWLDDAGRWNPGVPPASAA